MPAISIVTVTYNAAADIARTIDSVQYQTLRDFEHIIVDGGSTDKTMAIVNAYGDAIAQKISEPDQGIYDAMNKGLAIAQGEWVMFLNAGDVLLNTESLNVLAQHIDDQVDLIYGDAISDYGHFTKRLFAPAQKNLTHEIKKGMCLFHNAILFRKSVHVNYFYQLTYKIAADYDVILRMIVNGAITKKIDLPLVQIETGEGLSYTNQVASLRERSRVMTTNKLFFIYPLMNAMQVFIAIIKVKLKRCLPERIVVAIIKAKK